MCNASKARESCGKRKRHTCCYFVVFSFARNVILMCVQRTEHQISLSFDVVAFFSKPKVSKLYKTIYVVDINKIIWYLVVVVVVVDGYACGFINCTTIFSSSVNIQFSFVQRHTIASAPVIVQIKISLITRRLKTSISHVIVSML